MIIETAILQGGWNCEISNLKSYGSVIKNTNLKHFEPVGVWHDHSATFEVEEAGATARDYNNDNNSNNRNRKQLPACK